VVLFAAPLAKAWLGARMPAPLPAAIRIGMGFSFVSGLAIPPYYILFGFGRVGQCLFGHVIQTAVNGLTVFLLVKTHRVSVESVSAGMVVAAFATTIYLHLAARGVVPAVAAPVTALPMEPRLSGATTLEGP
jgi:hypothetical protein